MLDGLIVTDATKHLVENYVARPAHALLLTGRDGTGKGSVAQSIARAILALPSTSNLREHAEITYIEPDAKNTISIEQIRSVQSAVRLKTTGKKTIRRVIIIEHAQRMTTEAQNALLKILEEPPLDTIVILTAGQAHDLLPTIQSRAQSLSISIPQKDAIIAHFAGKYPREQLTQAYFLSGGLPGLMHALLEGDKEHPLIQSVELAKGLLKGQLFDRLLYVEPIAKQRESALLLCEALERIAEAGLQAAAQKSDQARLKQWHAILKHASLAQEQLNLHANTKLVLSNLILQL